jgi:hypothetical protein
LLVGRLQASSDSKPAATKRPAKVDHPRTRQAEPAGKFRA